MPRLEDHSTTRGHGWVWAIVIVVSLAVVSAGVWFLISRHNLAANAAAAGGAGPGGKGGKGGGPVPVVVAKAHVGSMDIFLDGLGTVTGLNTVAIHTRVDGQLDKVLFTEGQMVKTGDLLVEIDPRPFQAQLAQAQGQLVRDEALLKDAQVNLKRFQDLLKQGQSITQAQVDTQQALVDQYAGAVKTDNGMIAADQLNIEYCQVKAPFAGRIGLRMVDVGNIVHATDTTPLAVIAQIQPITVVFTISEDDLPRVMEKLDPKNPMEVEAWDRDLTKKLADGKLLAVDNQVDATTGTVKIKGIYENKNNELFPNEFVNARLKIQTLNNVIIVPTAAMQRGPDSTYVFVVKDDKTIDLQPVTAGPTEGSNTIIATGLSEGQIVVTDGVDKLQKGTQVTIRERAGKKNAATQPSATQPGGAAAHAHGKKPGNATTKTSEASTQASGNGHSHQQSQGGAE